MRVPTLWPGHRDQFPFVQFIPKLFFLQPVEVFHGNEGLCAHASILRLARDKMGLRHEKLKFFPRRG